MRVLRRSGYERPNKREIRTTLQEFRFRLSHAPQGVCSALVESFINRHRTRSGLGYCGDFYAPLNPRCMSLGLGYQNQGQVAREKRKVNGSARFPGGDSTNSSGGVLPGAVRLPPLSDTERGGKGGYEVQRLCPCLCLLLLSSVLTGCSDNLPRESPVASPVTEIGTPLGYSRSISILFTNQEHRFLLLQSYAHDAVAVCEVTDASLIDQRIAYRESIGRIVTNELHATGFDTHQIPQLEAEDIIHKHDAWNAGYAAGVQRAMAMANNFISARPADRLDWALATNEWREVLSGLTNLNPWKP